MINVGSFDRQLADLVWMISTALRAGYSLRQVQEQLPVVAPEPSASVCAALQADLNSGVPIDQAVMNWQQSVSSKYFSAVAAVLRNQQQNGGNLTLMLDPVGDDILEEADSDGAFFPAMRTLAESVNAPLPERVR